MDRDALGLKIVEVKAPTKKAEAAPTDQTVMDSLLRTLDTETEQAFFPGTGQGYVTRARSGLPVRFDETRIRNLLTEGVSITEVVHRISQAEDFTMNPEWKTNNPRVVAGDEEIPF